MVKAIFSQYTSKVLQTKIYNMSQSREKGWKKQGDKMGQGERGGAGKREGMGARGGGWRRGEENLPEGRRKEERNCYLYLWPPNATPLLATALIG